MEVDPISPAVIEGAVTGMKNAGALRLDWRGRAGVHWPLHFLPKTGKTLLFHFDEDRKLFPGKDIFDGGGGFLLDRPEIRT